jgi:hypothetical protein
MLGRVRSKLAWLIGLAAIATVVLWLIGIFALNHSASYGKLRIPGTAIVHLPAGEVDVSFDAQVTSYGGSSNVSLPIPHLGLSVVPIRGGLIPGYESSVGSTTSVNSDAHRQVAKLDVPAEGRYRVTVSGDVGGYIEPTLELGAPGLATKILLGGGALVFLLLLIYTLLGVRQPQPASAGASSSAAHGKGEVARGKLPWRALGIEVIGAAGLLALLFGGGDFHIPPQGRADGSGQVVSGSSSAAAGGGNPLHSPLPKPSVADTVGADSAASLFREENLAKALRALTARVGGNGAIALMAIYPGELDLVQDDRSGNLHRVRVTLNDTVTVGPGIPTTTGPAVIYIKQVTPSLITTVERQLTTEDHVARRHITALVLDNHLPNSTSGWDVKTVSSAGGPGPTFRAQLDGTGLQKLG